jgi:hypothetical protein
METLKSLSAAALIVCTLFGFALMADAQGSVVFESRPAGSAGGGQAVGTNVFPGHTFRLLERTEITALGVYGSAFGPRTIFAGIHRLPTTESIPDVINDSTLLGTANITVNALGNYTGAVSMVLDPGWYAFLTGTGRYGATAGNFDVSLSNTGTSASAQVFSSPYTINATTNARSYSSNTIRFFAEGNVLPPVPLPPNAFLFQTARPSARWTQSDFFITNSTFWGTRFEVTDPIYAGKAATWLRNGASGSVFAAIIELSGPGASPLHVSHPNFMSTVVASTLINVGSASNEYTGDFGGIELGSGHYALVFGTGLFGATGTANIMSVNDQLIQSGSLSWNGSFWTNTSPSYRMALNGTIIPEPGTLGLAGIFMLGLVGFGRKRSRRSR